jgi:thioesterase domain-containing protein
MKKMVQMEEEMELQEKQIEILKGGCTSSCATTSTDPTDGLSKALEDLDLKGDEIEKLKRTIATQGEEMKDKDKVIAEYEKLKAKMLTDIEQLKNKLSGKCYLVGARHIIWDEIINEVGRYGIISR